MELLAPAGNFEKLKTALHFGADAVYFSGKKFGLRAFAGNFTDEEILQAFKYLHSQGKKGYVTINIVANDEDFNGIDDYLNLLVKAGADGVIVSDLGLISYIKKHFPQINVHVSTQANINNSHSAKVCALLGASRIVLARELSLKQVENIHKNLPELELEVFVHGAMCISYSGRCLLSNYLTGRDSNRGACVQACRWKYYIREENREDELPIEEDERGTYILNSKDLCLIDHLDELIKAGVTSFKIEGRMKSDYYVASVVNAYRRAIDGFKDYDILHRELEKTSHRRYTTGFMFNDNNKEYLENSMPVQTYIFVAVAKEDAKNGRVKLEMRNRFKEGDILEILAPNDNFLKTLKIQNITDEKGQRLEDVKLVQQIVEVDCPYQLKAGDILRIEK